MVARDDDEANIAAIPWHGGRRVAGVLNGLADGVCWGCAILIRQGQDDVTVLSLVSRLRNTWVPSNTGSARADTDLVGAFHLASKYAAVRGMDAQVLADELREPKGGLLGVHGRVGPRRPGQQPAETLSRGGGSHGPAKEGTWVWLREGEAAQWLDRGGHGWRWDAALGAFVAFGPNLCEPRPVSRQSFRRHIFPPRCNQYGEAACGPPGAPPPSAHSPVARLEPFRALLRAHAAPCPSSSSPRRPRCRSCSPTSTPRSCSPST